MEIYVLDENRNWELAGSVTYYGERIIPQFIFPNFISYKLNIKKL